MSDNKSFLSKIPKVSTLLHGRWLHLLHMTELEKKVNVHHTAQVKLLKYKDRNLKAGELYNRMHTTDPKVLELLKDGYDEFNKKRVVERIYKEHFDELDLNRCPKCNRIARTPKAKQCRYCKHDWH